jgi:spore coat polysaccharide biosynthesis protein SpsF
MKKTGVVVLSRYDSSRLPGKSLIDIEGKPVLSYIIERLMQVFDKESIVIATSNKASDNPIIKFAEESNIKYYRGSLENVAQRFYNAAIQNGFEYAVRINGDNVFADINLLKEMKKLAASGKYDFISNVKNRTYPKGMSIEIVRTNYFQDQMEIIQKSDRYKEHVTLYLYENTENGNHYYCFNEEVPEAAGIQLALDTPEDLLTCKQIISKFSKPHWNYNLKEIYEIFEELNHV